MEAFHNDRAVKAKYLGRVRAHAKADRLIQGQGWANGNDGIKRGCAVGCTLEKYDHSRYPIELGVPVELAHLEDRIFESLTTKEAMKWPAAFLSAIPVGADLSMVWPKFAAWTLRGLPAKSFTRPDVKAAVAGVLALYDRWIETGTKPSVDEWMKARFVAADAADAAAAAAYSAADADAADAAAADAATADADAADAAAYTAADAADAAAAAAYADAAYATAAADAADAAARSQARAEFWTATAAELLRLLRGCRAGTPKGGTDRG